MQLHPIPRNEVIPHLSIVQTFDARGKDSKAVRIEE